MREGVSNGLACEDENGSSEFQAFIIREKVEGTEKREVKVQPNS